MDGAMEHTARLAVRTANARLKDAFYPILWGSITLSTAAHFAFLSNATFRAGGDYGIHSAPEMEQVDVRREFELPPPPADLARPAVPILSTRADVDPDLTIAAVTFQENPVEFLPPPPTTSVESVTLAEQPTFTPYEVKPELTNAREMQSLLEKSYPAVYRNAGIGGKAVLWVFIDEKGEVRNTRVVTSTGFPELDAVAEGLLRERARFTPAYNRDQRVPVWIQIPIEFSTRNPTS